ncbi:7809_t:CDS:2, partial [Racocetra persica]
IENHCNLCQYSLDIKRCTNTSCCGPPRSKDAIDFLQLNNSFLLSVTKAKDGYFINPIHLLEYYDFLKIPNYDSYCPFLDETTYSRLRKSKNQIEQNSLTFDNFFLLPSQQYDQILLSDELHLREWTSDN